MKAKPNTCHNCDRIILGANFCTYCGGNQADLAAFLAEEPKVEVKPAEKEKTTTEEVDIPREIPLKPKSKQPLVIGLGLVGFFLVAAAIGSGDAPTVTPTQTSTSSATSSSAPEEAEPVAVAFSEVADSEVIAERASQTCSPLAAAVSPDNESSFWPPRGPVALDEVDQITSGSRAKDYVSKNSSWIKNDYREKYRDSLREAVQEELSAAVSELGYSGTEFSIDQDQWTTGFLNAALRACELEDTREANEREIDKFQDNINRVIRLSR
jgi:hypothetical protein